MKRTIFSRQTWRSAIAPMLSRILPSLLMVLVLMAGATFALEPPRSGEISQLKQRGQFADRLRRARTLNNHRVEKERLERALARAKTTALIQQGLPTGRIHPQPPPSWKLMPTTGQIKTFALLIDFSDYPAYNSVSGIDNALFGDGTLLPNPAPHESLRAFYQRSSYNQLHLSGITLGWYRPPYSRDSMPQTTEAREALIKEAINYFKRKGLDFTQFDNDGNGHIEYFMVIWAGPDNGWANFWWGYQTSWEDSNFTIDGKRLGKYSWQWEYNGGTTYAGPFAPGVVIHETGHALGLPDYYDYNPSVGPAGGVGGLDQMDGNWGDHNCFSKWILEWLTPTVVGAGSQSVTLKPAANSQDAVLVMPDATSDDSFREFFMVQNRFRTGNDLEYPADGMLIWHVDARLDATGSDYLNNNSVSDSKLLKLVQADGLDRIEKQSAWVDEAMYYQPGKVFTPVSVPSSKDNFGVDSRVNVTGIMQAGTQMSATFGIDGQATLATLAVTRAGNGSGTVIAEQEGISCGSDCKESYLRGTAVTLTAVQAPGSRFSGWSGGGCSGTGPCTVVMSEDAAVTASFETTVLWQQDFSTGNIPAGWEPFVYAGEGWWWFDYTDNSTGGSSTYALGAPYGNGPYDIALRTMKIDLSPYRSAGLEFRTDLADDRATADVDVSVDGGSSWMNMWRREGALYGPRTVEVDISAAAGKADAMVRFRTYGEGIWWSIDDVKLMATSGSSRLHHFQVIVNPPQTVGVPFGMLVVAMDENGDRLTDYRGTVRFTSSDPAATLPRGYTFTAQDSGIHNFDGIVFRAAGSPRITVTDAAAAVSTTVSVHVVPGVPAAFTLSAPTMATAGLPVAVTVTATDLFGNVTTGYTGTIRITSSDSAASLPADPVVYAGAATFYFTPRTAGNHTVTATDTVDASLHGTSNLIAVTSGGATRFSVVAPSSTVPGTPFTFITTALDSEGNTATAYTGTVHFTSSDASAVLPGDQSLSNGVGTFLATLRTPGNQTISAADLVATSIRGTSDAVNVSTARVPDLAIYMSHRGDFSQGQRGGVYSITVRNRGTSATTGAVTVSDTPPAGLTITSLKGAGWGCNMATLTCTRKDSLGAGSSYPPITVTVIVADDAPASVTNVATVSGGGDADLANNTATDETLITPLLPDVTINKRHLGTLRRGQTGATYTITVRNSGSSATSGQVTVVDTLPAGLVATGMRGNGWTCSVESLRCVRSNALAVGDSYPSITLTVNVNGDAPSYVTNMATVSGGGEMNTSNNVASDPTVIKQ